MRSMLDATPEACTVIEEVGSTGVGALALAFLILAVSTVIFLVKAWNVSELKRLALNRNYAVDTVILSWTLFNTMSAAFTCARLILPVSDA